MFQKKKFRLKEGIMFIEMKNLHNTFNKVQLSNYSFFLIIFTMQIQKLEEQSIKIVLGYMNIYTCSMGMCIYRQ